MQIANKDIEKRDVPQDPHFRILPASTQVPLEKLSDKSRTGAYVKTVLTFGDNPASCKVANSAMKNSRRIKRIFPESSKGSQRKHIHGRYMRFCLHRRRTRVDKEH